MSRPGYHAWDYSEGYCTRDMVLLIFTKTRVLLPVDGARIAGYLYKKLLTTPSHAKCAIGEVTPHDTMDAF